MIITFACSYLNLSEYNLIFWLLCFPLAYYYDEYFNRENQIKKSQRMFPISDDNNEEEFIENEEYLTK